LKLLIVEDDLALSDVLAFTLRRAGFTIVLAHDGLSALATWEREQPDLIVLDLNLPKLDGLAVCRQIRAQSDTPIIILSVRGGDEAVVKGLELGADDYVVKPFSPSQLVARVKALLRRAGRSAIPGQLEIGEWVLDRGRNELQSPTHPPIRLTPLETRLLESLLNHTGQVLPSDNLIQLIWGAEGGDRAMLKQLVYRLRAKLETTPDQPIQIETVPGIGYALRGA
jgi:DNA-binding response OmpR family regulator